MWQNKYVEYLSGQVNMFDELEILLARLQKNEANVSPELLATKYKKPYDKLKEKIKICIQAMILALLSDHMLFSQSDNDIMKSTKNNILNFVRSNDKMNTIYRTAYVTYNFNTVMEFISDISAEIEATYYLPYLFPPQILSCKFLYYHIFKTCFAFALTNWIIGPEMITVISVHTPNFPPNKTPVTTTKISNAIRTNLICQ